MGMFNTVNFTCLECGATISDQTKSGDCLLREYDNWHVPAKDVDGLEDELCCDACGTEFEVVKPAPPPHVEVRLKKIF